MHSRRGSAAEFALVVPLICLFALGALRVGLLAVRQFRLERNCAALARALATAPDDADVDLQTLAETRLQAWGLAAQPTVDLQRADETAIAFPRDPRPVEIVDVALQESVSPGFPLPNQVNLIARVREARQP